MRWKSAEAYTITPCYKISGNLKASCVFQKENVKEILEICLIFRLTENKKTGNQLLAMYLVKS